MVAVRCCTHAAFSAALTASCGWRTHKMQRVSGGNMLRRPRVHSGNARQATVKHTGGAVTHRDGLCHNALLAGDRKHVAHGSCCRPNLGAASTPAASERSGQIWRHMPHMHSCRHTAAVPGRRCAPVDVELQRRERGHHLGQEARGVVALRSACGASEGDAKAHAQHAARGRCMRERRKATHEACVVTTAPGCMLAAARGHGARVVAGATGAPRAQGCAPRL